MKKREMYIFMEEMEAIGDTWTMEEVERVYGSNTLDEALADRKGFMGMDRKRTPEKGRVIWEYGKPEAIARWVLLKNPGDCLRGRSAIVMAGMPAAIKR